MPAASYPNFAGKHGHEAIFSPAEVVASLTAKDRVPAPDAYGLAGGLAPEENPGYAG